MSERGKPDTVPTLLHGLAEAAEEAAMLARLARDLPGFLQTPLGRARSVTIGRLPPLATGAGKVLPFHLVGRSESSEADRRADPTAGMSDDTTLC